MALYLGILLFSFILTSIAIVPFISLLYRFHFTRRSRLSLPQKAQTPVGGGILLVALVTVLYAALFTLIGKLGVYINSTYPIKEELNILFLTFLSFGLLGLYDDLSGSSGQKKIKSKYRNLAQLILAFIISFLMFHNLGISIINVPFYGVLYLSWFYVPVAALIIYSFAKGSTVTDGPDGLAGGTHLIALLALWAISQAMLDTVLSVFTALWVGSLIAFLYFNVYPARITMGNSGSLSFGATLAVIGLLLGKAMALLVIGGIFVAEGLLSLIQTFWLKIFKRGFFFKSPLHYILSSIGWPEPKIAFRAWLGATLLAIAGFWLSGK